MPLVYEETFDHGPGGWMRVLNNFDGQAPLKIETGAALCRSPWWIDYNHAPPHGGGYLHLLMYLDTCGPSHEVSLEYGGVNRFVRGGFSTDLTDAYFTLRLKGELELRGARVCLLVQGTLDGICSGWVLTGQPFDITADWSEQTVHLVPQADQWTSLGTRPERSDMYGTIALERILADVNTNIHLILFPLTVVPMGPVQGDITRLRPGRDYPVWQSRLPEGYVWFDTVRIAYPARADRA